nr:hypothetical protein [uncultured Arsenicibacter sp.]
MLLDSIASDTVVQLTIEQLIAVVMSLVTLVGGVITYVRKEERQKARFEQLEKSASELADQVTTLTSEVNKLVGVVEQLFQEAKAERRKPGTRNVNAKHQ